MQNIRTAPHKTRKFIKSLAFTRKELWAASRAERDGTAGAGREVDLIISKFEQKFAEAEAVTKSAEAAATDFEFASLGVAASSPLAKLAALRSTSIPSGYVLHGVAAQARAAADKSRDRLDDFHDDIQATRQMGRLSHALRNAGFEDRNPAVRRAKSLMTAHKAAHKERTA
ncbi:hypothetical protein [Shimia thalassica]|uniref:hypothetical protein n=1 Tax=Shimia thalassica TaxID=1715693 RepID=UPI0026E192C4|nr:hypothetical protein [Shimia thalassica]MDO6483565.1 hypothetical protein [Shimia thalassica]